MSEIGRFAALVRHGTFHQAEGVPSAHLPHGLTEQGREEAEAGAHALWVQIHQQGVNVDPVIDCSPLRRAWETATILGRVLTEQSQHAFTVREFAVLAERSLGAAANLTSGQIERTIADDPRYDALPPGWKRNPETKLPYVGAESLLEAGQRVARHVEQRTAETEDGVLKVYVGHGGAFRHAAYLLGVLTLDQVGSLSMYCGQALTLGRNNHGWTHVHGMWKPRKSTTDQATGQWVPS